MKKNVYVSKTKPPLMGAEAMAIPGVVELFAHAQAMADAENVLRKKLRKIEKELARRKKRPLKVAPKYR